MMKRSLTPLLILALLGHAQAQWTSDLSANTTVRAVTAGETGSPLVTDGPDGSTYISWFENGSGSYQLRMQRLDGDGNRMWPDTGLVVSAHPQNTAIYRYDLQTDRNGNAIVAFQDERTGALDIVAYKISPDGSFLWGPDGVELPTPESTGLSPRAAGLSNGNTVVAWGTNHSPGRIAFQLIGPDGDLVLPQASLITAATRVSRPVPMATDDGGFILQYALEGSTFLMPATMLAMRFDQNGDMMWDDPVQVSSKTITGFYFPQPVSDGHNGFYVAFNTGNPNIPSFTDVYVQRVRGDGSTWSTEGTRMDQGDANQKYTTGKGLARVNDTEGLMVPIRMTDGSQNQSGVAVQRVDTSGALPLGTAAIIVIPVSGSGISPLDLAATGNGAVIVHETSSGFNQDVLGATRVDLSGAPLWSPEQQDLSTLVSGKSNLAVTSVRDGQAVVVWQDSRTPQGLYAQNITGLDVGTLIREPAAQAPFMRLEQNPAPYPVLLMAPGSDVDRLEVFSVQGERVYGSSGSFAASRLELPLAGLPAGVYIIRAWEKGRPQVLRWVK